MHCIKSLSEVLTNETTLLIFPREFIFCFIAPTIQMLLLSSFTFIFIYFTVVFGSFSGSELHMEREEGKITNTFSPGHVIDNGESMFRAK
jgi:hypothetical protein